MKNKKIIYLLLPLVIIIWGVVLYRVFSITAAEPILPVPGNTLSNKDIKTSVLDTFSIDANYRDPFLDKVVHVPVENKIKSTPLPKVEKILIPLKWPVLTYLGIIKNQDSGKKITLINIDGESNFMKEGDEVSGIHLLKVYKDSVEVSFMKERKMVRK